MTDTVLAGVRQDFMEEEAFDGIIKGWVAFRYLEVEEGWLVTSGGERSGNSE